MSDNETVLVVDDNRPLADGFADLLSAEYEVVTAYTGQEALEAFDADIDAVLLDRDLPDASGDDLLDAMRDDAPDCPVVVVSGAVATPGLDCDAYLTKPVAEPDTLRRTVADLLDRPAGA